MLSQLLVILFVWQTVISCNWVTNPDPAPDIDPLSGIVPDFNYGPDCIRRTTMDNGTVIGKSRRFRCFSSFNYVTQMGVCDDGACISSNPTYVDQQCNDWWTGETTNCNASFICNDMLCDDEIYDNTFQVEIDMWSGVSQCNGSLPVNAWNGNFGNDNVYTDAWVTHTAFRTYIDSSCIPYTAPNGAQISYQYSCEFRNESIVDVLDLVVADHLLMVTVYQSSDCSGTVLETLPPFDLGCIENGPNVFKFRCEELLCDIDFGDPITRENLVPWCPPDFPSFDTDTPTKAVTPSPASASTTSTTSTSSSTANNPTVSPTNQDPASTGYAVHVVTFMTCFILSITATVT
eukprot:256701_1